MPDYTRLPIGEKAPHRINAVIEIPKDSVNKYEYDKQLHVFKLDRTLFSPVHYPGDYGFIPCTLGQDGDPLDVLVLVEAPSFPGCLIEVRPIGVLSGRGGKRSAVQGRARLFAGVLTQGEGNRTLLFRLQGARRQEHGDGRLGRWRRSTKDRDGRA
jgi:hypothetical protein